jgi:spore germination cell wall hydrolase CwlJ-like protein
MSIKTFIVALGLLISLNANSAPVKQKLDQLDCVASVVYLEGRGTDFAHQLALANVVYKRAKLTNKSWCDVAKEKGLFVSYSPQLALKLKKTNHVDFQDAKLISLLAQTHRDPSNGATNFWNKSIPHNSAKYDQVAVLSVHKFLVDKELVSKVQ